MAVPIVMPRLGWTAEEGVLKEWLLPDGSPVQVGDALFSVEGDKAVEEIEALDAGILRIPAESPLPGQSVPVGTLLGYIAAAGEVLPTPARTPPPTGASDVSASQGEGPGAMRAPVREHRPRSEPAISPRARALATRLGVDWTALTGSGRTGRIIEKDVRAAADQRGAINITPVARRLAAERNVDLDALGQAFPGQRISVPMVQDFAERDAPADSRRSLAPFSPTRQAIARHLTQSLAQAAPVTLHTEMDATEMVRLRAQLQADGRTLIPSYNALFMKAAAHALGEHPYMNARVENDGIQIWNDIHIGLAVDTAQGLLVPVVRHANAKGLLQIQEEINALSQKAVDGQLAAQDMQGSAFTLTNLGAWAVDGFTPILPAAHAGILGIGRIQLKPAVVNADTREIAARRMAVLSLTFDHRAVDGAPAAQFLQRVKNLAEQPYLWLTG